MLRLRKLIAMAAGIALLSGQTSAATVSPDGGTVLISNGEGFLPITGDVEVSPGGQVMVQPGGMAHITYAGGCVIRVGPGQISAISETSPCNKNTSSDTGNGQQDTTLLIGGGLVLAGGLGLALALSGRGSPASP